MGCRPHRKITGSRPTLPLNKTMNMLLRPLIKFAGLALVLTTLPAIAGTNVNGDPKDLRTPILSQNIHTDNRYFRADEWQVDVFGAYAGAGNGRIDSGPGGGVGVNYFVSRFFGVGIEGLAFDGGSSVDTVSTATLNFIARYPIESLHLAPYAFIGAGGQLMTNEEQVGGDFGGGVEYRLTRNWGVFVDGRYVLCADTNDYGLARLGVRFAF